MERAGSNFHIIRLLDQAALVGPVFAEVEDYILKIHGLSSLFIAGEKCRSPQGPMAGRFWPVTEYILTLLTFVHGLTIINQQATTGIFTGKSFFSAPSRAFFLLYARQDLI